MNGARLRCAACGVPVASTDAVEVRIEYRSAASRSRMKAWCERVICRGCALDEVSQHDFPHGRPNAEQGRLL